MSALFFFAHCSFLAKCFQFRRLVSTRHGHRAAFQTCDVRRMYQRVRVAGDFDSVDGGVHCCARLFGKCEFEQGWGAFVYDLAMR